MSSGNETSYLGHNGPHLVYLPEVPFDGARFLTDVEAVYARLGRCQVAISEGIRDTSNRPIVTTLLDRLQTDAHGNVQLSGVGALGDALAEHVQKNLKTQGGKPLRVRADTFGYLQRSWPDPSPIDVKEARAAAAYAVRLAAAGAHAASVAITRKKGRTYAAELKRIELREVAGKTRTMPPEFISGHCNITPAFLDYVHPLVGKLPHMTRI
jgi:6-phosphofructokinase 1